MTSRQNIKRNSIKVSLFGLIFLWYFGIVLPALIPDFPGLAILIPFLKVTYSHVCHQMPHKSVSVNGYNLLVCSRCLGIYSGIILASVISLFYYVKLNLKPKYLLIFALPMLADVICSTLGVYGYNKFFAFITGVIFGSIVFAYILNIIFENFVNNNRIDF